MTIKRIVAKFKDSTEFPNKIISFDLQRLAQLQSDVHNFVVKFLSKERLEALLKENLNPEKRQKIESLYNNRENIMSAFLASEKSVENEIRGGRGSSGSKAPDLYLMKTCLIGAELNRREHAKEPKYYVFTPQIETTKNTENYVWFDFSQGKDKHSSMHYPKDRILYARFLAEYLETKNK